MKIGEKVQETPEAYQLHLKWIEEEIQPQRKELGLPPISEEEIKQCWDIMIKFHQLMEERNKNELA